MKYPGSSFDMLFVTSFPPNVLKQNRLIGLLFTSPSFLCTYVQGSGIRSMWHLNRKGNVVTVGYMTVSTYSHSIHLSAMEDYWSK
eukprot:scaffold1049_cov108-Cylindrotheca_fusiformis.AAC.4